MEEGPAMSCVAGGDHASTSARSSPGREYRGSGTGSPVHPMVMGGGGEREDDGDEGVELKTASSLPVGEKEESAIRRKASLTAAVTSAANLTKGAGENEDGFLMLKSEHWLEQKDNKHRYGSNLKPYHKAWAASTSDEDFFTWLDEGEGAELDLPEKPRSELEAARLKYLESDERSSMQVHITDGGMLQFRSSGELVDTLEEDVEEKTLRISALPAKKGDLKYETRWIYILDLQGRMYVGRKVRGKFHHSSFLGGGAVKAAGSVMVEKGKLREITAWSGHYRPQEVQFENFVKWLRAQGADLEGTELYFDKAAFKAAAAAEENESEAPEGEEGRELGNGAAEDKAGGAVDRVSNGGDKSGALERRRSSGSSKKKKQKGLMQRFFSRFVMGNKDDPLGVGGGVFRGLFAKPSDEEEELVKVTRGTYAGMLVHYQL